MYSARCLMVFNICVKFHENMSSGFKVMERTRKLTDTHTEKRQKLHTPMGYFVCREYKNQIWILVKIHLLENSKTRVVGFVLRKLLTCFEMLIVPHAVHCEMAGFLHFTSFDSLAYCFGFSSSSQLH